MPRVSTKRGDVLKNPARQPMANDSLRIDVIRNPNHSAFRQIPGTAIYPH
jgi:hypothetical protein